MVHTAHTAHTALTVHTAHTAHVAHTAHTAHGRGATLGPNTYDWRGPSAEAICAIWPEI